jgi:hypothetical protein
MPIRRVAGRKPSALKPPARVGPGIRAGSDACERILYTAWMSNGSRPRSRSSPGSSAAPGVRLATAIELCQGEPTDRWHYLRALSLPTPSERLDPAMSHDLILTKENGRICTLALNRPEKKNSRDCRKRAAGPQRDQADSEPAASVPGPQPSRSRGSAVSGGPGARERGLP